ncbi:MAG: sulfotransferase [Solirubrobacterales bacterium]
MGGPDGLEPRGVRRACRDFYDTIFTRYATDHGKVRWGEKTPYHTWHIDGIARLFPDAVFVAIARHPGAAVASNVRRFESRTRDGATRAGRRTSTGATTTRSSARPTAGRAGSSSSATRIWSRSPEAVMRELLDWLGEPWSDSVLAHHAIQAARGGARVQVEGRTRVDEPVDVSRITKWTRTMDDSTRALVRQRLGRIAEFYGYDIEEPLPVRPLREGSLLMGGMHARRLIDQFPDLDLRTAPVPGLAERPYFPRKVKLVPYDAQLARPPAPLSRQIARAAMQRLPPRLRGGVLAVWRRVKRGGASAG